MHTTFRRIEIKIDRGRERERERERRIRRKTKEIKESRKNVLKFSLESH